MFEMTHVILAVMCLCLSPVCYLYRTEQNRTYYLFDVNYTVSSQSNTIIIYISRSQILSEYLNHVVVLILRSWLNPYMPIKRH